MIQARNQCRLIGLCHLHQQSYARFISSIMSCMGGTLSESAHSCNPLSDSLPRFPWTGRNRATGLSPFQVMPRSYGPCESRPACQCVSPFRHSLSFQHPNHTIPIGLVHRNLAISRFCDSRSRVRDWALPCTIQARRHYRARVGARECKSHANISPHGSRHAARGTPCLVPYMAALLAVTGQSFPAVAEPPRLPLCTRIGGLLWCTSDSALPQISISV